MRKLSFLFVCLALSGILVGCASRGARLARAEREKSMHKAMELALACHVFAENHGGMLPPSLEDAMPYLQASLVPKESIDPQE